MVTPLSPPNIIKIGEMRVLNEVYDWSICPGTPHLQIVRISGICRGLASIGMKSDKGVQKHLQIVRILGVCSSLALVGMKSDKRVQKRGK